MDRIPRNGDSVPDPVSLGGVSWVNHGQAIFSHPHTSSFQERSFPPVLSWAETQPVWHCLLRNEPAKDLLTQGLIRIRSSLKEIGQRVHMRNQIFVLNKSIIFCFSFHCPLGRFHIPTNSTTPRKSLCCLQKFLIKNFFEI